MATSVLGTLGNIDELSIGGRIITNVPSPTNSSSTLITLSGVIAGSNLYSTLRLTNGSAGYQVTAGKTLMIVAIQAIVRLATANAAVNIGYANTDAGFGGSAPTTPVYFAGSIDSCVIPINNAGVVTMVPNFPVPATKYPFMYGSTTTGASIIAFCYEI